MINLLKILFINLFFIINVNAILNFRCDKSICVTKETQIIYHEINNKTLISLNGCELTTHYRDVTEIQIFWLRKGITKNFKEFERVKIFKIRYGQLKNLKTLIFDGLNELEVLRLTDNEIEKIESFPKLNKVINLNLSKNLLKFIDENYFANLANLQLLTLEDNKISLIHPNSFNKNLKLEEINLNRNKLKSLNPLIFIRNYNLKEISLNYNEINFVNNEIFTKIQNLQILHMRGNKINKLSKKMFSTNLKWIDLSKNVITYVPSNFYDDLTHVNFIDFSNNICLDQTYPIDVDFIHLREQTRKYCHHLAVLFFNLDE